MISRFFTVLWDMTISELNDLRFTFISVVAATIIGILAILFFRSSIGWCLGVMVILCLFSAYRLFSPERFVKMEGAGAALESAGIFVTNSTQSKTAKMFKNAFIRSYFSLVVGMFFVQISIFMMMLLYAKYTVGELVPLILIGFSSLMILILNKKLFGKLFVFAAVITILIVSVISVSLMFPQLVFHTRGIVDVRIIPASTAQIANEIKDLQAKQQEAIDNEYLNKVLEWQKANPGKEPPQRFKDALNRVSLTGRISS